MEPTNRRVTRATTGAGIHPAPLPLYSPARLAFGSVEAGELQPPLIPTVVAAATARLTPVSAGGNPSTLRAGDSSELTPLTLSKANVNALGSADAMDVDDGWTPVTRKTSRTHRERSSSRSDHSRTKSSTTSPNLRAPINESETTTVVQAMETMSAAELDTIAERYEAMAASYRRAQAARKALAGANQEKGNSEIKGSPEVGTSVSDERAGPKTPPTPRPTVEEVEDEEDLIMFSPRAGPSRDKGKGIHPGNWGNISSLANFSEADQRAQREALATADLIEGFEPIATSTPKPKKHRKRSKSPKVRKVNIAVDPPVDMTSDDEPASTRGVNSVTESKSGLSAQEVADLVAAKFLELQAKQEANELRNKSSQARAESLAQSAGNTSVPRGMTPGKFAIQNFFQKALSIDPTTTAKTKSAPGGPSDGSSSSSESSSDESSNGNPGNSTRRSSSPRMSSKRKRGHIRQQKMLLKPIPPSRYSGEPDADADGQQVYFISYYLDGKARDFYKQIVERDESNWTLERFFTELHEFCFPVNWRNEQRKKLNRCFQGAKDVATHVAEWALIADVRAEIYRGDVDPEVATSKKDQGGAFKTGGQKPTKPVNNPAQGPNQRSRGSFHGRGQRRGGRANGNQSRSEVLRTAAVRAEAK